MPQPPPAELTDQTHSKPLLERRFALLAVVALITVTGLALRVHLLGTSSLTLDEADSAFFARMSWREFLTAVRWGEGNMTMILFFGLLREWIHLGDSEVVMRGLPILFGVATIPAVYQLGNRFLSRNAGLAGATLLAVHSYHLRYSQELRSYSMVLFFLVLSAYFFLAAIESPDRKGIWAAYLLTSTLAIYAHLFALLVLVPQWLSLPPSAFRRIGLVRLFWIAAATGLLMLPEAAQTLLCAGCRGGLGWIPRPTIDVFLLAVQSLAGSYIWTYHRIVGAYALFVSYAGFWILAVLGMINFVSPESTAPARNVVVRLLTLWLIFPFVVLLGFPLINPFSQPKYLFEPHYIILCVPAAVLLAGQGISVLSGIAPYRRLMFPTVLFVMLALSLEGIVGYYSWLPSSSRDHDWRSVTRYILARQEPGDAVLFPYRGYRPYLYYVHHELSPRSIASAPPVAFPVSMADALANPYFDSNEGKIDQVTRPYERIWLVSNEEGSAETREAASMSSALDAHFHLVTAQYLPGEGIPNIRIALFAKGSAIQARIR